MQADIQAFRNRERPPKKAAPVDCSQHHADSVPDFLNGRVLRDYQTVSLHWMMENFRQKRSCILGDEMVCLSQARVIEMHLDAFPRQIWTYFTPSSGGRCNQHIRISHSFVICLLLLATLLTAYMLFTCGIRLNLSGMFLWVQGLGKTAQSIATLAFQKQFLGVTGPHIVIAPLTTLGHWRREIQTWTDMVCCLLHEDDVIMNMTCVI